MLKNLKNKKAFTLVELIVVMAVIGVLVLLAMPKFIGHTKEAKITEIKSNVKQLENASERYYMDNQEWPRLSDTPYTAEQIESFAQEIKNRTGAMVTLDPDGSYYEISYDKLERYVQKPKDDIRYILQNPIGEVFYLDKLTTIGENVLKQDNKNTNTKPTAVITMTPEQNINTNTIITWNYTDSTDPDGDPIVNAEWQNKQNFYGTAGAHTVQLRVQDSKGMWSDWTSKTFNVAENPLDIEILNETFTNSTLNSTVWNSFVQDGGSSISVSNGQLLINNRVGYEHTGAGIYTKNPIDLKGIITVEYDWTMGAWYGSALGNSVGFYNFDNKMMDTTYYGGYYAGVIRTRTHYANEMYIEKYSPSYTGNSKIFSISPAFAVGTTYRIKVVLDTTTRNYSLYVNDDLKVSHQLTSVEMGYLGTRVGIQFMKGNYSTNSTDKYDNIKIYQK